ncbi:MAG: trypsin-like peptidase domain-containing protein [Gemmatimonadota bacterium]|nr:trypsin-like peptidase domain-containing protein [Gemmatimonadota bacterium]
MRRRILVPLVLAASSFPVGLAVGSRLARPADRTPDVAPAASAAAAVPDAGTPRPAFASAPSRATPSQATPARERGLAGPRSTPIVAAAEQVAPSVVSITVISTRTVTRRSLFDEFLGMVPRQFERRVPSLGSGFAIDDRGTILTNEHVVAGGDSIVVADMSGALHRAEVIGSDPLTDIAVLQIRPGAVPAAPLGTSSDLVVGEPAIAIGNPFGYVLANAEATVTAGVVSGVGRDILDRAEGKLSADLIQTDAAINPGNSGGPLVSAEGRVIGVNASILSKSGGSEGIGFAIPIDRALRIAAELREFGQVRRPWVGVEPQSVETKRSRFPRTEIRRVAPNSPAGEAGLAEGDELLVVDGRPITSPLDWEVGLLDAGVGAAVEVQYRRGGRIRSARLRIEELPSEQAERVEVVRGLELISVTPGIAVERSLEVESGALVAALSARAARVTGMREGDVIVGINRRRVDTAEDALELFRSLAGSGRIFVTYNRGGRYYNTWPFQIG